MEALTLKLKIATLWILAGVATYRCTSYLDPGLTEELLTGTWAQFQTPAVLMFYTLEWLIPLAMAFVTFTLKDAANRWVNLVLGVVFTLLNIGHLVLHFGFPTAHGILIVASTVVATGLIAWYAWRWPQQQA